MANRHVAFRLLGPTLLAAVAFASPFSEVVVFGDSPSDDGNTFAASGGMYPETPTTMGRQSSGPVAVEYLADLLGIGLNNRAWAGATTGQGNTHDAGTVNSRVGLPGMRYAFEQDLASGLTIDPNALYVVWGGPNDMLAITSPAAVPGVLAQAVTNLVTITSTLQGLGAQHILVPGMPDISLTPRLRFLDTLMPGTAALFQFASLEFNSALQASLPPGATYFDTNSVFQQVYNNPGAYGFASATTPCVVGQLICAQPADYVFWDDLHPSSAAHQILGQAFYEVAAPDSAIPEPSTWLSVSASLLVLAVSARRRGGS